MTQHDVKGNNSVTFPIRKQTPIAAMYYEKKGTYENNSCLYKIRSALLRSSDVHGRVCTRGYVLVDEFSV